jgi:pimeloyl-ACP methyl ester carboxylesterase
MTLTLGDQVLVLPSGRRVGYRVYGDPSGKVVLNCHGGLVSGHDVAPAAANAGALGLCIVSPDRPGVGRTDRLAPYRMIPWVRTDVVPLLEHLQIDEFSVMGWSEGGQYALAVAVELASRVTRCAVIAGCLPLDDPARFNQLNRLDHTLTMLAKQAPPIARGYFRLVSLLSTSAPSLMTRSAIRGLPRKEADAVRAQGRWMATILGEGARQSRGGVDEYLTMSASWGFAPEDVGVPVRIFQGDADHLVPKAWGEALADRIPGATLTTYPSEGHFIALTRSGEILGYLADATETPGAASSVACREDQFSRTSAGRERHEYPPPLLLRRAKPVLLSIQLTRDSPVRDLPGPDPAFGTP